MTGGVNSEILYLRVVPYEVVLIMLRLKPLKRTWVDILTSDYNLLLMILWTIIYFNYYFRIIFSFQRSEACCWIFGNVLSWAPLSLFHEAKVKQGHNCTHAHVSSTQRAKPRGFGSNMLCTEVQKMLIDRNTVSAISDMPPWCYFLSPWGMLTPTWKKLLF